MANETGESSEECVKEFSWKFPSISDLTRRGRPSVVSPEFHVADATWCLNLNLNLCFIGYYQVSLYLVKKQSSVPEHRVHHKTALKTHSGEEYLSQSDEHTFVENSGKVCLFNYTFKTVHERRLFSEENKLSAICHVRVQEEASTRSQQHRNEPSQTEMREASTQTEVPESVNQTEEEEEASKSVQKLQLDYSKLLKSEEDSDVCLKVSDKEFRAHRCILRARSTVFSAMFEHDTEEKASGEVVIDDLDPESFPDFLQHVYAGRVEGLSDENVFNLYSAADKYDLQELKSACREYIKRTLSVDTFCDIMIVALKHEEEELLKMAIDYFSANIAEIFVTENWRRFLTDHPTEANELLIRSFVPRKENG